MWKFTVPQIWNDPKIILDLEYEVPLSNLTWFTSQDQAPLREHQGEMADLARKMEDHLEDLETPEPRNPGRERQAWHMAIAAVALVASLLLAFIAVFVVNLVKQRQPQYWDNPPPANRPNSLVKQQKLNHSRCTSPPTM